MAEIPYTSDQLASGVANALAAHDMEAVHDILLVLARVDPHRADLILKTIEVGMATNREASHG